MILLEGAGQTAGKGIELARAKRCTRSDVEGVASNGKLSLSNAHGSPSSLPLAELLYRDFD
jgi:hypothetical protein